MKRYAFLFAPLWICTTVLVLVRGQESVQAYTKFAGMQINNQTSLVADTLVTSKDSMCVMRCTLLGQGCFAAQYDSGSKLCLFQINCGSVSLIPAASSTTVVFVPRKM